MSQAERRWRQSHPEYHQQNRTKHQESQKRYRRKYPERARLGQIEYRKKNLELARLWGRSNAARRYARQKAATVEQVDFVAILAEHGMVCHICGADIATRADLHFDHVIPLVKGGPHSAANIRPSHALCNMRKGSRLPD